MPDKNNQQAAGKNKPKKGSLLRKAMSEYGQARQIVGSIKEAWASARKPSIIKIAREHRKREDKLAELAQKHAERKK